MTDGQSRLTISNFLEKFWKEIQDNPATKREFKSWEKSHLRDLMKVFSSYKSTMTSVKKVKSILLLSDYLKTGLIMKLADHAIGSRDWSEVAINRYANEVFAKLVTQNKESLIFTDLSSRLMFLLPQTQKAIEKCFFDADFIEASRLYCGRELIEIDIPPEEAISILLKEDVDQAKDIEITKPLEISEKEIESALSSLCQIESSNFEERSLEKTILYIANLLSEKELLHKEIINRFNEIAEDESYNRIVKSVAAILEGKLPFKAKEYRVILGNIRELPAHKGFVGRVELVETSDGELFQLSVSEVIEYFPSRGDVYIKSSFLTRELLGHEILPVIVEASRNSGSNHYHVKSFWEGIEEVIDLELGFCSFELLCEKIKSFNFDGAMHSVWFRLIDGSLISPVNKKKLFTSQCFFEKWRFIPTERAPLSEVTLGYIKIDGAKDYVYISMLKDSAVFKKYVEAKKNKGISVLPDDIQNRLKYLLDSKSIKNDDTFLSDLVELYAESPDLTKRYQKAVDDYVRNNSPEVLKLRHEEKELKQKVTNYSDQIKELADRYSNFEKKLIAKAQSNVNELKNDITAALNDPLVSILLAQIPFTSNIPQLTEKSDELSDSSISSESGRYTSKQIQLSKIDCSKDFHYFLRQLRFKPWSEALIEQFKYNLVKLIEDGVTIEIVGDKSFVLAEFILSILGQFHYEHKLSIFAEEVERVLYYLADGSRTIPLMVTGLSDEQVSLFEPVLAYRKQTSEKMAGPVLIVNQSGSLFNNFTNVLSLNVNVLRDISGEEYDREDFDAIVDNDLDRSFCFIGKDKGILCDYLCSQFQETSNFH